MEINTKELVLATILGATAWVIKATMPGIPLDFAIPGAKIDFGWAPAILAAIWLGVKGGLITGVFMSLVPIPTLFLTGLLFTPWPLAVTGYLARTRGWDWKAALIFPLLHVPLGVAIYTWIIPVFTFFVWSTVLPAILLTEYVSAVVASIIARQIKSTSILKP